MFFILENKSIQTEMYAYSLKGDCLYEDKK